MSNTLDSVAQQLTIQNGQLNRLLHATETDDKTDWPTLLIPGIIALNKMMRELVFEIKNTKRLAEDARAVATKTRNEMRRG